MISRLNRQVFTQLSYGLYIVTSHLNSRLNGQIVNTVLQVTSEPPRVAVVQRQRKWESKWDFVSGEFGTLRSDH